jgi:multidrug efflux pump subunit AcrA (membrane-fusion protein)
MPAALLRHVAPGDPVAVRLPLESHLDIAAAVSAVSPVPDPTSHAYPVRIQIGNPKPGQILAGLECAVTFPKIDAATKPWWRRLLGL